MRVVPAVVVAVIALAGFLYSSRPHSSSGATAASAGAFRPKAAPPKRVCQRFASPSGSNAAGGTLRKPFRTVKRLINALRPGWTGCLLGGTYEETVSFWRGGEAGLPVVLRTAPGYRMAIIHGNVIQNTSAPYVTISGVFVDARNVSQTVAVQLLGNYGRLTGSVVAGGRDPARIGIVVGYSQTVVGVEIDHNRISGFGVDSDKTHGIYVEAADRIRVHDNYIFDNSGYGIHLWTHSVDGRFYNNTIDGNGYGNILIGGQANALGGPSTGNSFSGNILSNPRSGKNVVTFWSASGPAGANNVVSRNCVWQGSLVQGDGVAYAGNVTADPDYADRDARVFRLGSSSGCAGYGVRSPSSTATGASGSR